MSAVVDEGVLCLLLAGIDLPEFAVIAEEEPVFTTSLAYLLLVRLSVQTPRIGALSGVLADMEAPDRDRYMRDLRHGNGQFQLLPTQYLLDAGTDPDDSKPAASAREIVFEIAAFGYWLAENVPTSTDPESGELLECHLNAFELTSLFWATALEVPLLRLKSNVSAELQLAAAYMGISLVTIPG
ncbi:MAG: hypothetical protein AAF567_10005 [Actinomycetota bacterium]